eukprot:g818.t1
MRTRVQRIETLEKLKEEVFSNSPSEKLDDKDIDIIINRIANQIRNEKLPWAGSKVNNDIWKKRRQSRAFRFDQFLWPRKHYNVSILDEQGVTQKTCDESEGNCESFLNEANFFSTVVTFQDPPFAQRRKKGNSNKGSNSNAVGVSQYLCVLQGQHLRFKAINEAPEFPYDSEESSSTEDGVNRDTVPLLQVTSLDHKQGTVQYQPTRHIPHHHAPYCGSDKSKRANSIQMIEAGHDKIQVVVATADACGKVHIHRLGLWQRSWFTKVDENLVQERQSKFTMKYLAGYRNHYLFRSFKEEEDKDGEAIAEKRREQRDNADVNRDEIISNDYRNSFYARSEPKISIELPTKVTLNLQSSEKVTAMHWTTYQQRLSLVLGTSQGRIHVAHINGTVLTTYRISDDDNGSIRALTSYNSILAVSTGDRIHFMILNRGQLLPQQCGMKQLAGHYSKNAEITSIRYNMNSPTSIIAGTSEGDILMFNTFAKGGPTVGPASHVTNIQMQQRREVMSRQKSAKNIDETLTPPRSRSSHGGRGTVCKLEHRVKMVDSKNYDTNIGVQVAVVKGYMIGSIIGTFPFDEKVVGDSQDTTNLRLRLNVYNTTSSFPRLLLSNDYPIGNGYLPDTMSENSDPKTRNTNVPTVSIQRLSIETTQVMNSNTMRSSSGILPSDPLITIGLSYRNTTQAQSSWSSQPRPTYSQLFVVSLHSRLPWFTQIRGSDFDITWIRNPLIVVIVLIVVYTTQKNSKRGGGGGGNLMGMFGMGAGGSAPGDFSPAERREFENIMKRVGGPNLGSRGSGNPFGGGGNPFGGGGNPFGGSGSLGSGGAGGSFGGRDRGAQDSWRDRSFQKYS